MTTSGAMVRVMVAIADSGTCALIVGAAGCDICGVMVAGVRRCSRRLAVAGTRSSRSESESACQDGSASSTTRYWFAWPKMVEICRWPNESYSVSSTACIDTPSRIAASRSTEMSVLNPSFC